MARKSVLSLENLISLGSEKLAKVILNEAGANAAFRKRVAAALAGSQGAEAVAKLIDRRLAALERARAMVAWEKERALAQDLGATVASILGELAPLSPILAVERLLRFVDSHGFLFERIDDSSGRIQDVYWRATEALPDIAGKLVPADLAWLPARLMISLDKDTHGLGQAMAVAMAPLLPEPLLLAWDGLLERKDETDDSILQIRQAIADARGDVDSFLALEERRSDRRRNPLAVAERLLAANRLDEALEWCRRERKGGLAYASATDMADGRIRRSHDLEQVRLEVRILEEMKDHPAAQALRWSAFEATLDPDILRDYIRKLDDFIEYEERDRAFALAASSSQPYTALAFFLAWPWLDRAAQLVLDRHQLWDGRHYDILPQAAETLEESFPLAATVLYRALLNDILGRGKSLAYGHGACYLARLQDLAEHVPVDSRIENHATYVLGIRKAHGRKSGFWSLVDGTGRS